MNAAMRAFLCWGVTPSGRVRENPANAYSAGPGSAWQSWFLSPESIKDAGEGNSLVEWALVEGLLNRGSLQRVKYPLELPLWWRGSGRWAAQDQGGWYAPLVQAVLAWTGMSDEERGRWEAASALLALWDADTTQRAARLRAAERRALRRGLCAEEAQGLMAAEDAAVEKFLSQEQEFLAEETQWEAIASRPVLSRVDLDRHFPAPYFDRERKALLSAVYDSCGEGKEEVLILNGSDLQKDLLRQVLNIGGVYAPHRPFRPALP
ncbi:MAG: hypothetical protein BWY01_01818 [Synergistetes bacterium ADurb.Bin155]|nr:MAG: hypothetical protein BWY01_01818 [Synergistetes bacterium ADurb.Bin155]